MLRYQNDSLMITHKTLNKDNPKLNCRLKGFEKFSPKRIILDIKEKITSTPISTQNLDSDKLDFSYDDIYTALSSLGYKKSQIDKAVKN